ncbi:MAG: Lrp/AsnC ligand binding domain-containing protein [Desulfosarcina sp.]|nr:Lrp/AsnC ligand binding domain-containing protein [Desulfosarcina sp.]MBC2766426.1 Lrp/AsnC family transcriptional regulator [Desulfosarcina sp.]
METIAALDGVQSVVNVTGRYDLVIEVCVASRDALRRFLVEDLSTIPGICFSESLSILRRSTSG